MNQDQRRRDKRKADLKEHAQRQKEADDKFEQARKIFQNREKYKTQNKQELDKALQLFEDALNKIQQIPSIGSSQQALYFDWIGKVYMELENYDAAHEKFVAACKFDNKSATYHSHRGNALLKLQGRIRDALEAYDEAITLNAGNGHNFWNRAKVFAQLRSFQKAIEDYKNAIQLLKNETSEQQFRLLFEKGTCHLENKEFALSQVDLVKALEYEKDNHQCINTLGLALFESQKYEQALDRFQKAIDLSEQNSQYFNNKALALHNLQRYSEALVAVNNALDFDQESSTNYYTKGNVLFKMGKYDEALENFNIAVEKNPRNCMYYHSKGLAFNQKKDYVEAIIMFQESITIQKDHIPSWYHLGIMYHKDGQLQKAVNALTKVLEIKQAEDREVRESRGKVYQDLNEYEFSIMDFDVAIELDTSQPLTYIYRGFSYIEVNKIEQAIQDFKHALELGTKSPKVFSGIGKAYQKLKEYDKSLFYVNLALEQRPNDVQFLIQRSDIYVEIKKYKYAIEDLKLAAQKKPENALVFYKRGIAYFKNLEYRNCIHDLYTSYELRPISPYEADLHYHIGISFSNLKIYDKAIEPLSEAIMLNPTNPQYLHERAKAYLLTEQADRAVTDFSKLILMQPNNSHAYFGRAFAFKAINQNYKSAVDFDTAKSLDPSNPQLSVNFTMLSNIVYIPLCKPGEEMASVQMKPQIKEEQMATNNVSITNHF